MQNSGYPCPGCGAPADLTAGCRACGRGPDPVAAEVVRLDAEIAVLTARVEQARRTYAELGAALRTAQQRRAELAARVRASRAVPAGHTAPTVPSQPTGPLQPTAALQPTGPLQPTAALQPTAPPQPAVSPWPTATPGPAAATPRRETSTRTVQGLLFVLGGLLLGTAAIVFTAVAWASVGIVGRAAILAGFTALTLAVPPVAARRGLRGTAETFAAVGLLLVLLDGYAAWTVDLFGVAGWPGTRYVALTGGISAAVAAGYGLLTRLAVPWFVALLVAQPVLPLLAAEARPDVAGWALVLTGVALVDLAVLAGLRTRPAAGLVTAGRVTAWAGYTLALAPAAGYALVALARGEVAGTPYAAGLPLLAVGVVLLGAALVAGGAVFRGIASGVLVALTAAAVLRPVAEVWPSLMLVAAGLLALGTAVVVRLLPRPVRTGPWVGALVVVGWLGQVPLARTGALAADAVARSTQPPWQGAEAGPQLPWSWQLPVAVLLFAAAVVLLVPRAARLPVGLGGGVVAVFALPAVGPTPWPVVVAVELTAGVALLLAAVLRPGRWAYQPVVTAVGGALLAWHALLVGTAAPVGAGVVLAASLVTGLVVAGRGRRLTGPGRWLAGPGLMVAVLAVPALVVVTSVGLDLPLRWRLRGLAVAVGLLPVALVAVRRHWSDLTRYAATALAVALPLTGFAPLVVPAGETLSPYLAWAVLVAAVGLAVVRSDVALRVAGAGLTAAAVVALVPTGFRVLVAPYGWLAAVWSGAPAGVGLPSGIAPPRLSTSVTLLVLLLAMAVAGRSTDLGRWGAVLVALPLGALAGPVLVAGAGAPWPALPGVSLLLGLTALLTATLIRPPAPTPAHAPPVGPATVAAGPSARGQVSTGSRARRLVLPVLAGCGLPLVGAGLAGLLPTRAGTLAGLGLTLVAAVVVGVAGRAAPVRPFGWAVAVLAGTGFASTAGTAADLPLRETAFAVLAVAALALATGATLARRRPGEATVLDAAAQGVALVALLLTVGSIRYAAVVCTLWGAAVALRALRPGESAARRWTFATIAGGSELLGAWLLLIAGRVALLEAYTLPAAALALLFGVVALRTRQGLTSWPALGPGLAAALLPSLVSVLFAPDPQPWRRLLLGAGALAVVLVGAVRRWQAPVVSGGSVLALLALHEAVRSWDLLPRWVFLAVGGFVLIGLATTYERRRRDLARLRSVVSRLG